MRKKNAQDLVARTRNFALASLRLCAGLPKSTEVGLVRRQLVRAATSVGANYRAARRAKSRRDFIAKLSIVEEEADECIYWLELLQEMTETGQAQLRALQSEADQLVAIVVASKKTARKKGL
ncbi:MAG TPA: four helix bundle protein [Acidobacteriota bacterium]|nr:four helix bundle protein [Acidobacteriota bacterium]